MLGITPQTIRLYERRGLLNPYRTRGNTRIYTDEDLEILKMIQRLTKEMSVNLSGVEVILRMNRTVTGLQKERDHLMKMLYEAGEMVSTLLRDVQVTDMPVKSSLGHLVKFFEMQQSARFSGGPNRDESE